MNPRLLEPGNGPQPVREIPIAAEQFLIGRGTDCDLRLHVSEISRHHCLIRIQGSEATLVDLGSSNGTYVNGARVLSQAALHTGDEIRVGPCRFFFDLGDDPGWQERFFPPEIDPLATTSRIKPGFFLARMALA
jgi:pSer/pThr/pTyr-binding forkhead associated (FHA) protein